MALAGDERLVQLKTHDMYFNRETTIKLRYFASPFVYKIEPRKAFRTSVGTEVRVFISNLHQITTQDIGFQYCKFGLYTVQVSAIKYEYYPQARTNFTVFVCKTPYLPSAEVVQVEIMTDNQVFSSSMNNQFEFINPPILTHVDPPIAPLGVNDVLFRIYGGPFDPAYEYFCQFKILLQFQNETKANFTTNKEIRCTLPDGSLIRHSRYVSMRVVMKDLKRTFSYTLPATMKVLFYEPLSIVKQEPQNGDISGGTEVFIEGRNIDNSYGGIYCRFGGIKVKAESVENQKLIKCITPPAFTPLPLDP